MEKHKTCSFFGQRKIQYTDELRKKITQTVEDLIVNQGVQNFLFGSRSAFDEVCHLVVTQLKEKYQNLQRIAYTCKSETCVLDGEKEKWEKIYARFQKQNVYLLVVEKEVEHKTKYTAGRASYVERNQAMVNDSDYCIFYYDENYQPEKKTCGKKGGEYYQPKSGTALAYVYARQKKKVVINLLKV